MDPRFLLQKLQNLVGIQLDYSEFIIKPCRTDLLCTGVPRSSSGDGDLALLSFRNSPLTGCCGLTLSEGEVEGFVSAISSGIGISDRFARRKGVLATEGRPICLGSFLRGIPGGEEGGGVCSELQEDGALGFFRQVFMTTANPGFLVVVVCLTGVESGGEGDRKSVSEAAADECLGNKFLASLSFLVGVERMFCLLSGLSARAKCRGLGRFRGVCSSASASSRKMSRDGGGRRTGGLP